MKSICVIFILSLCSYVGVAQTKNAVATEEDYNYMIKGYSLGVKSGMGLKDPYVVIGTNTFNEGHYQFDYISLGKKGASETEFVGYIVKVNDNDSNNEYYFALPGQAPSLLERSFLNIRTVAPDMVIAFLKTYIRLDQGLK